MDEMTFTTCVGVAKLTNLSKFVQTIEKHVHPYEHIKYQTSKNVGYAGSFHGPGPSSDFEYETHIVPKRIISEVTNHKLTSSSPMVLKDYQEWCTFSFMEDRLKTFIIKRPPDFSVRNLDSETFNNLAIKYAEGFGSDPIYGFPVIISKYQKYFVLTGDTTFKLMMSEVLKETNRYGEPSMTCLGDLIELFPEKWVTGRFENLTYLAEINAMHFSKGTKGNPHE